MMDFLPSTFGQRFEIGGQAWIELVLLRSDGQHSYVLAMEDLEEAEFDEHGKLNLPVFVVRRRIRTISEIMNEKRDLPVQAQ